MTGTISGPSPAPNVEKAARNFARLMNYVASLYCAEGSSCISTLEAHELTTSVAYTLGILDATPEEAALTLSCGNPIKLWHNALATLDKRVDAALELWKEVVAITPPIHNVALRDTLTSLGGIKSLYDTRFAAHEVPCSIDYQLSNPLSCDLMGIDYVEAWLAQLHDETRWLERFDPSSCIAVLERVCPDYRGLHVNLYDLLLPHENELAPHKRG